MILYKFYLGLFALFISPQIFIKYRFPTLNYSFVLIYSIIASFTSIWALTLLSYYFKIPNIVIYILANTVVVLSILYMVYHINKKTAHSSYILIWILGFILMLPLAQYIYTGFTLWDAVVSWNRWGIELYHNTYQPIHAAYPLLIPALFSIIYKIQGTHEIWLTAKAALLYLPIVTLVLPLVLYKESKNNAFVFISIFIYPYLLMHSTTSGTVDMPVMIMGMLTLIVLYAGEIRKGHQSFDNYVYASLLLAGLASITKQSGLAFLLFDLLYILLNLKYFTNKKKILFFVTLSLLYFLTFLSLYYLNAFTGVTGNIELLKSLSAHTFSNKELLWHKFFSYPPNLPIFQPLADFLHIPSIFPYLMGLGFLLFFLKETRKYNSLSLLSSLFLIAGFFAWGKYASYHPRNSWWAHSFLIMFVSINLHHFILWYKQKKIPSGYLYLPLIILSFFYVMTLDDQILYDEQQNIQKQLGNKELAQELVQIVQKHSSCIKIYTNDFMLRYSYYTKDIQEHIITSDIDVDFLYQSVNHHCKDGSFIVFRGSTFTYPIWRKEIAKLKKEKKIVPYGNTPFIYYIPPQAILPQGYFEEKTALVKKDLDIIDDKVTYHIDFIHHFDTYFRIYGWAFLQDKHIENSMQTYVVLTKENETYIIETEEVKRDDIAFKFKTDTLQYSGFKSYIFKKDFTHGTYTIHILLVDKQDRQHLINTHRTITINNSPQTKDTTS